MPRASEACIVGIGHTAFTRWGGIQNKSEFDLAFEAVLRAAADAGLDPAAIDGFTSFSEDATDPALLQVALAAPLLRFSSMVWGGRGGGTCGALAHAVAAVEGGYADHVVIVRSLCQGQTRRYGHYFDRRPHTNFVAPFGLFAPPQMMALLVQRYRYEHGLTERQMAAIALACRANAQDNPAAVMRGRPLTMEAYLASRMVAEPFRVPDCCLETDGACAILVTSWARARDLRQHPVRVLAAAQGSGPHWGSGPLGSHNMPLENYGGCNVEVVAEEVFGRAGLRPADISVAQIYDHFTGLVLLSLEGFGFCGRGEAGAFVEAGGIDWPDGRLPINTAGGSLSEAYVHGLNLLIEGVRQMRGQSTRQVKDAQTAFVCGGTGVAPGSAAILAA